MALAMALLDLLNKFNDNQTVLGISLLSSSERLMKMIVTLRNMILTIMNKRLYIKRNTGNILQMLYKRDYCEDDGGDSQKI